MGMCKRGQDLSEKSGIWWHWWSPFWLSGNPPLFVPSRPGKDRWGRSCFLGCVYGYSLFLTSRVGVDLIKRRHFFLLIRVCGWVGEFFSSKLPSLPRTTLVYMIALIKIHLKTRLVMNKFVAVTGGGGRVRVKKKSKIKNPPLIQIKAIQALIYFQAIIE